MDAAHRTRRSRALEKHSRVTSSPWLKPGASWAGSRDRRYVSSDSGESGPPIMSVTTRQVTASAPAELTLRKGELRFPVRGKT